MRGKPRGGAACFRRTPRNGFAFEKWFNSGIRHPLLVGAHLFQFRDQPVTGRGDGEATLRGVVNVADTPHFDLVQANRRLGYKLYEQRAGK